MTLFPDGPLLQDFQKLRKAIFQPFSCAKCTKTSSNLTLPSRLADGFYMDVYDSVLRRSLLTAVERCHTDFIMWLFIKAQTLCVPDVTCTQTHTFKYRRQQSECICVRVWALTITVYSEGCVVRGDLVVADLAVLWRAVLVWRLNLENTVKHFTLCHRAVILQLTEHWGKLVHISHLHMHRCSEIEKEAFILICIMQDASWSSQLCFI